MGIMWKNFIPNSTDEETVNNAFCTNGLFKISSESEVCGGRDPYCSILVHLCRFLGNCLPSGTIANPEWETTSMCR